MHFYKIIKNEIWKQAQWIFQPINYSRDFCKEWRLCNIFGKEILFPFDNCHTFSIFERELKYTWRSRIKPLNLFIAWCFPKLFWCRSKRNKEVSGNRTIRQFASPPKFSSFELIGLCIHFFYFTIMDIKIWDLPNGEQAVIIIFQKVLSIKKKKTFPISTGWKWNIYQNQNGSIFGHENAFEMEHGLRDYTPFLTILQFIYLWCEERLSLIFVNDSLNWMSTRWTETIIKRFFAILCFLVPKLISVVLTKSINESLFSHKHPNILCTY